MSAEPSGAELAAMKTVGQVLDWVPISDGALRAAEAEVEAAQKEILGTVRNLADQGQIELGGKGDEYV